MPSAKLFDASIDTPQGRQFRDVQLRRWLQKRTGVDGNVRFNGGVDFQHVFETREAGEGGANSRFSVSKTVTDVFVPHRMQILRDFLETGKPPVHAN